MAMLSVIGLQGSGKSHQAVKYVIAPNFAKGRRIFTNIKGFNIEELKKYCIETLKANPEDLGEVVLISDRDIRTQCKLSLKELQEININDPKNAEKLKSFYPFLLEIDNQEIMIDQFSTIKSGDIVVIDEAGSFYKKVSDYDMEFFRMHRHFTNKEGLSCELCFLFQTRAMVHRDFFNLMFQVYQCKKLGSLGLSNAYSLNIYDGSSMSKDLIINSSKEFYDPKVFPIYSSYANGKGKEQKLDKRGNIFKSKAFIFGFIFVIVSFSFAIYSVTKFFKPKKEEVLNVEENKNLKTNNEVKGIQKTNNEEMPKLDNLFNQNQKYRITGVVDFPKIRYVIIQDQNNNVRFISPDLCIGKGMSMTCSFDNLKIERYSINTNNNDNSYIGGNNENQNNRNQSNTNNK